MTYILYNPLANNGNGLACIDEVQEAYRDDAPELRDLTQLDTKAFLADLTADDLVILCGGDGTINRLVNDLDGTRPAVPIRVWRFGTGNDFLRDVTADSDPNARTALLNDYIRNLPLATVGAQRFRFVNGCSGGVDALVCAKMNEGRGRKQSYVTTALRCFFRDFKTTTARVTVDGVTHTFDRVWIAGAMNGRYQGGGMKFAPDQDRNSGLLCCYVWHGTSPVGTLLNFPRIMKGTHPKIRNHCEMRFGREITIEFDDPQAIQLDGETVTGQTRLHIVK